MKPYIIRRSILDGLTVAIFLSVALTLALNPTDQQMPDLPMISLIFLGGMVLGAIISFIIECKRH